MGVVPFFNMSKIRATMKANQYLLDKADACYLRHDLQGALEHLFQYYEPLGAYPYFAGLSSTFWSHCSESVAKYGNDATYAMIWNSDWNDTEPEDGPDVSALLDFYMTINREYELLGFRNPEGGFAHQYVIERHKRLVEYSDAGWLVEPKAWTADRAGLWHGSQTGEELLNPIEIYATEEGCCGNEDPETRFVKIEQVSSRMEICSPSESERMGCIWHFWSKEYGCCKSSTPLEMVAEQGSFEVRFHAPGGSFKALCANERIVATIKDYLEGGVTKEKEDRCGIPLLPEGDAVRIYERFALKHIALKPVTTIRQMKRGDCI